MGRTELSRNRKRWGAAGSQPLSMTLGFPKVLGTDSSETPWATRDQWGQQAFFYGQVALQQGADLWYKFPLMCSLSLTQYFSLKLCQNTTDRHSGKGHRFCPHNITCDVFCLILSPVEWQCKLLWKNHKNPLFRCYILLGHRAKFKQNLFPNFHTDANPKAQS